MKKLILIAGLIACGALQSFAQGVFAANNNSKTLVYLGTVGGSLVQDDYSFDAIYATSSGITDSSALVLSTKAVDGDGDGGFTIGNITVANYTGTISVEIRAWKTSLGSTYATAYSADNGLYTGTSAIFNVALTVPPSQVAQITSSGFKSFAVNTVPEPATIALGVMGLSLLVFRRRK
jgi:hypothetical protein